MLILDEYVSSEEGNAAYRKSQAAFYPSLSSCDRSFAIRKICQLFFNTQWFAGNRPFGWNLLTRWGHRRCGRPCAQSMQWPFPTLKVADNHDPLFKDYGTMVDSAMGEFTGGLSEEEAKELTIRDIGARCHVTSLFHHLCHIPFIACLQNRNWQLT